MRFSESLQIASGAARFVSASSGHLVSTQNVAQKNAGSTDNKRNSRKNPQYLANKKHSLKKKR